jgi:hypothetical protein
LAKLIQICASQNDLFGLDGEGVVYQYNFNTNNWVKLGHAPGDRGDAPLVEGQTASGPLQSERRSARERRSRPL